MLKNLCIFLRMKNGRVCLAAAEAAGGRAGPWQQNPAEGVSRRAQAGAEEVWTAVL